MIGQIYLMLLLLQDASLVNAHRHTFTPRSRLAPMIPRRQNPRGRTAADSTTHYVPAHGNQSVDVSIKSVKLPSAHLIVLAETIETILAAYMSVTPCDALRIIALGGSSAAGGSRPGDSNDGILAPPDRRRQKNKCMANLPPPPQSPSRKRCVANDLVTKTSNK